MFHLETLSKCNPRWVDIIKAKGYNFLADQRLMSGRPNIAELNSQLAQSAFSTDKVAVACLWDNSEKYFRFFAYKESSGRLERLGMSKQATPHKFGAAPERLPTMEDFWTHNIDAKRHSVDELARMLGMAEEAEEKHYEAKIEGHMERLANMADDAIVRVESGKSQQGRAYSYAAVADTADTADTAEAPDPLAAYLTGECLGGMDPERIKLYVTLGLEAGMTRQDMADRLAKALTTKRPNTTLGRIVAGLAKDA